MHDGLHLPYQLNGTVHAADVSEAHQYTVWKIMQWVRLLRVNAVQMYTITMHIIQATSRNIKASYGAAQQYYQLHLGVHLPNNKTRY